METATTIRPDQVDTPTFLPPADCGEAAFSVNGFIALPRITSDDDVGFIRTTLMRLFAKKAGRSEGMLFDFAGTDEEGGPAKLPQLLDPRNFAPELLKTEFFHNAEVLAKRLLGPNARFLADHALLKPARDGAETPWHQDDAFRPGDIDCTEVSIWMPLQPVNEANGCLGFIPGSHRWDVLPHRWLSGDGRIHALECHTGFDPGRVVLCPLPAGGCTVHTNRTLHWAGPNRSDAPRLAYVLVFGLPMQKAARARDHYWLANKNEPRYERRRQWMRHGGYLVHAFRRVSQIPQVGWRETAMRALLKAKRRGHRTNPRQPQ
jgi:Phytanoyl-CoA dioxygenase (PhyH)